MCVGCTNAKHRRHKFYSQLAENRLTPLVQQANVVYLGRLVQVNVAEDFLHR